MRKIIYPILAVILFNSFCSIATTRKVLFIGNSYTYTNNMPAMVDSIARALGDTFIYDSYSPGGYSFLAHSTDLTTISKIFSQQWDVVVMHDQSQKPAFPPSQVATDVYPYARTLDSMVHANDTCTQTMFLMTWGHANGDPSNCASYPVICTYDGMQMRLRESYLQMATDNHGDVAPVGSAFRIMMDSAYAPWLYSPDSSHPVVAGSYLEALVVYSSIFHKSTKFCSYNSTLSITEAALLKRISNKVVLDSLNLFQGTGHYPNARFSSNSGGTSTFHFTSLSPVAVHHYWSFGDGGHDTVANPIHPFGMGTYLVSHTVATNCFSETITDTVFGLEAVASYTKQSDAINILQQSGGKVTFEFLLNKYSKMEVFDSKGSVVRRYNVTTNQFSDVLVPGLYIFRLYSEQDNDIVIGKIGVY